MSVVRLLPRCLIIIIKKLLNTRNFHLKTVVTTQYFYQNWATLFGKFISSVDRKLLEVDERMRVSTIGFGTGNHNQLRSF